MKSILVTGGAGFIGANFVPYFAKKYPEYKVINLDKLTYAGNPDNLSDCAGCANYKFVQGDICDRALVEKLFAENDIRGVIHFAAESHVDNSITGPKAFIETNIVGTFTLLDVAPGWKRRTSLRPVMRAAVFIIFLPMKFMVRWEKPAFSRKRHPMIRVLLIPRPKPVRICWFVRITALTA